MRKIRSALAILLLLAALYCIYQATVYSDANMLIGFFVLGVSSYLTAP